MKGKGETTLTFLVFLFQSRRRFFPLLNLLQLSLFHSVQDPAQMENQKQINLTIIILIHMIMIEIKKLVINHRVTKYQYIFAMFFQQLSCAHFITVHFTHFFGKLFLQDFQILVPLTDAIFLYSKTFKNAEFMNKTFTISLTDSWGRVWEARSPVHQRR